MYRLHHLVCPYCKFEWWSSNPDRVETCKDCGKHFRVNKKVFA
ncbi:MAG: hypothetical protein QXS90_02260 [Candidatus Diapherotrites archaeon]